MTIFFYCGRLSSAQCYRCKLRSTGRLSGRTRSNRQHSGEASKTMDYKSVFTNLHLELQQNRSWIKGIGKNPQKSELIHWRQCLLSAKHRRVYTSSNVCHSHEWRVDTASGKTLKKLHVYTASEAKGLNIGKYFIIDKLHHIFLLPIHVFWLEKLCRDSFSLNLDSYKI